MPVGIAIVVDPIVAFVKAIIDRVSALITAITDGIKGSSGTIPVSRPRHVDVGAPRRALRWRVRRGDELPDGDGLVPVLMVAFAIAGFILSRQPELLDTMRQTIIDAVPGDLGDTLAKAMDSAVRSRSTVGVVGLLFAALTGINWMSGARQAMTAIWGGNVDRNPVLSKVFDLGQFVLLGLWFVVALVMVRRDRRRWPTSSWCGSTWIGHR